MSRKIHPSDVVIPLAYPSKDTPREALRRMLDPGVASDCLMTVHVSVDEPIYVRCAVPVVTDRFHEDRRLLIKSVQRAWHGVEVAR